MKKFKISIEIDIPDEQVHNFKPDEVLLGICTELDKVYLSTSVGEVEEVDEDEEDLDDNPKKSLYLDPEW